MEVEASPTRTAFDAVYERQLARTVRLAYLLVRSHAVAEELAQEAFLRLYEHFAGVHHPPAFLRTTVVRLAITWQRRHRMEQHRLTVVGGDPGAGTRAGAEPELDEAWAALGRLAPERRNVLVLRYYADLAYESIGELLDCSAATARSRARRALADLRQELKR
jgi:RNA polymerase sigma factor (sigma-70 family)